MSQILEKQLDGKLLWIVCRGRVSAEYENEYRLFTIKDICDEQKINDSTTEYFLDFKTKEWINPLTLVFVVHLQKFNGLLNYSKLITQKM